MHLDEQVLFRCSGRNLVELPPETDADPAATAPGDDKETPKEAPAKDAAKGKAPAKKAAGTAEKTAPAKAPSKDSGGAAKAAAKKQAVRKEGEGPHAKKASAATPKPKPKVDDAYRPPPAANPDADPFAKQLKQ